MAQIALRADASIRDVSDPDTQRFSLVVRITHWLNTIKITLVDSLKHVGDGRGSAQPAYGYSWYAGI